MKFNLKFKSNPLFGSNLLGVGETVSLKSDSPLRFKNAQTFGGCRTGSRGGVGRVRFRTVYIKMISGLAREVCAGRDSVCCSWRCSMSAAQRTSFLEAAAERLSYASQTALGTLP